MNEQFTTVDREVIYKEQAVLRNELLSLKNCQITFLTYTVTGSGVLLGLAVTLGGSNTAPFPMLGAFYLIPLTIILPFWWIFFDKATTITRIVGYYRILEAIVASRSKGIPFWGWETALAAFRKDYGTPINTNVMGYEKYLSEVFKLLILQSPQKYWTLAYYTFASLALLAFFTCFVSLRQEISQFEIVITLVILVVGFVMGFLRVWLIRIGVALCLIGFGGISAHFLSNPPSRLSVILLMVAAFIVGISLSRNFVMVWRLSWGEYSYDATHRIWKRVLAQELDDEIS